MPLPKTTSQILAITPKKSILKPNSRITSPINYQAYQQEPDILSYTLLLIGVLSLSIALLVEKPKVKHIAFMVTLFSGVMASCNYARQRALTAYRLNRKKDKPVNYGTFVGSEPKDETVKRLSVEIKSPLNKIYEI